MKRTILTFIVFTSFFLGYSPAQDTVNQYFKSDPKPTVEVPENIPLSDSIFILKNSTGRISGLLHYKCFRANMHFNSVIFDYPAQFYTSIFYKDVNLDSAEFNDFVDFSGVTFTRDANFSHASFHKILFMSEIKADSVAVINFYNAVLPDLIDFSHNKRLGHVVDFTDANFEVSKRESLLFSDSRIFINLFDSDFSKLKLDYLHFRLCFYDPGREDQLITDALKQCFKDYENLYSDFKRDTPKKFNFVYFQMINSKEYIKYIKTIFPSVSLSDKVVKDFTEFYCQTHHFPARLSRDQTEAVYSRLVKNFENYGQTISHEACDIDRNNFISQFWNLSRYWNRWGYHNELIFYWTAGLLILFTILTYIFYKPLLLPQTEDERVYSITRFPDTVLTCTKKNQRRWKCAFVFTSIIFFAFALKFENLSFRRGWFVYIVIVNAVGLLCLGYLANFILQK